MPKHTMTTLLGLFALVSVIGCAKKDKAQRDESRQPAAMRDSRKTMAQALDRERRRRDRALARHLRERKKRDPTIGPLTKGPVGNPVKILAAAVKRRGGLARLKALRAVRVEHRIRGPVLGAKKRRLVWQPPDKMKLEFVGKLDEVRRGIIVNGRKGVSFSRTALRKLSAKEVEMYRHALLTDPSVALVAASKPGAELRYLGQANVGTRPAHVVRFTRLGRVVQLYIATDDGELLAYRYNGHQGLTTVLHSDFKVVSGIRLAATNHMIVRGVRIEIRASRFRINPKLPTGTFDLSRNPLQPK